MIGFKIMKKAYQKSTPYTKSAPDIIGSAFYYFALLILFHKSLKGRHRVYDSFGGYTVGNSYIAGAAEAVSCHKEKLIFLSLFTESVSVSLGSLYEEIEGAVGLYTVVAKLGKAAVERVTILLVLRNISRFSNTFSHNLLEKSRSTNVAENSTCTTNGSVNVPAFSVISVASALAFTASAIVL